MDSLWFSLFFSSIFLEIAFYILKIFYNFILPNWLSNVTSPKYPLSESYQNLHSYCPLRGKCFKTKGRAWWPLLAVIVTESLLGFWRKKTLTIFFIKCRRDIRLWGWSNYVKVKGQDHSKICLLMRFYISFVQGKIDNHFHYKLRLR